MLVWNDRHVAADQGNDLAVFLMFITRIKKLNGENKTTTRKIKI